jgi:hypothetical protein
LKGTCLNFRISLNRNLLSNYYRGSYVSNDCSSSHNGICSAIRPTNPRAYGDYQYFLSFGGDQYFDIPNIIENNFGVLGLVVHVAHFIAGQSFELAGYTAFGEDVENYKNPAEMVRGRKV